MFSAVPVRRTLLSLALVALHSYAAAQTLASEQVIVTASRFAASPAFVPIGATVITAEQIRDAGINNVNEAIRKIGGVFGRSSITGSTDYALDLRGFGSTSEQNMVVLLDGIRLTENELASPALSSVPIETVERIEIVRGGGSVMYGEGASGGIIQIITKRPARNDLRGSVVAETGSFGLRDLRASIARDFNGLSVDANLDSLRSDNYRRNNQQKQDNFSGGLQWATPEGRIGMRIESAQQRTRFAGSLTLQQFKSDPRQTATPDDFGSYNVSRYTLFGERHFGQFDLAAELSRRDRTSIGVFSGFEVASDTHTTQFSPRLRHLSTIGNIKNEFVTGFDIGRWDRTVSGSTVTESQRSAAVYLRDEVRFDNSRLALGARHEKFDKNSNDPTGFGSIYASSPVLNAWELQFSQSLTTNTLIFGKAGKSYRVANADENGFTPEINQPLQPQTSHDLEFGASLGEAEGKITARVFRHRLRNEIIFNPTVGLFGANVNLDPTQRQGIEVEAAAALTKTIALTANLQRVQAKFTDGPNTGNEVVLVPRYIATARLTWHPSNGHRADIGVQHVSSQRFGKDFSNACERIPAYTLMDARYAYRFNHWEFAVAGTNLADRKYFSNAFGDCNGNEAIYPDPGRQIKISARYDF